MRQAAWTPLLILLLPGCGGEVEGTLSERLTEVMEASYESEPAVAGVLLTVRAGGTLFSGAVGFSAFDEAQGLREDDPLRIASVTKTFTAAAALRLEEDGALSLDDPIQAHLTAETEALVRGGGYDTDGITVRMLLDHTAGMYDYTEADAFYEIIAEDPSHRFTRREQVEIAMDEGAPLSEPGEEYHYGDTHYILAGEILEEAGGMGLGETLRATLGYDDHGLSMTFLESLESAPDGYDADRLTHPYIGEEDTYGWDPSWDLYGGGGLVSTTGDLVRFMDALFDTEAGVFANASTLDALLVMSEAGLEELDGIDGGMGINRFYYGDMECFTGLGYFTTWAVRCPELDLTFAYTLNQSEPDAPDDILLGVLEAVEETSSEDL